MKAYSIYALIVWLLFVAIFATPYLARDGVDVSPSYSAFAFFCHQYPGRSFAVFDNTTANCAVDDSVVLTVYDQPFAEPFNGSFTYNRSEVGVLRAQVCIRDSLGFGYKFPVCARDLGFYFGLAFASLLFLAYKKGLDLRVFAILVAPFAIDGLGQLLGLWESTNIVRLATGFLAGVATSLAIGGALDG